MYYQSSARPNDPSEPESDRLKTLLDNLNNLRGKLKNFTVIDELGQPIGEISDLILDAGHQLNLVISQPNEQGQQPSVLLNGRRIRKVSVQTQSVFVDITKADVRFLPEYLLPESEPFAEQRSMVEDVRSHASTPTSPIQSPSESKLPPFAATTPDFSLDVMESPAETAVPPGDDFLTESLPDNISANLLDEDASIQTSTEATVDEALSLEADLEVSSGDDLVDWSQPQADLETAEDDLDFLELSKQPDVENTFEALSDLDLPNEARSLDEFSLSDIQKPESDGDLVPADTNPVPENYTLADLGESQDEWAEFDRVMGEASTDATSVFDLGSPFDEASLDANPVAEAFTLSELEISDRPSQPLPELTFETGENLPELNLVAEDSLSELNLESTEDLIDIDLTDREASLPDLSLEPTENSASLDIGSLELSSEESDFSNLDLERRDNLPELNVGSVDEQQRDELVSSLSDLSVDDIANPLNEQFDLDLGNESASASSVDLDFGLEERSELDLLSSSDQPHAQEEVNSIPEIGGLDSLDFGDADESPQGETGVENLDSALLFDATEPLPDLTLEDNEVLATDNQADEADAIAFIEENELLDLDLDELNANVGATSEPAFGELNSLELNQDEHEITPEPSSMVGDSSPETIESLTDLDIADDASNAFEFEPADATANFTLTDSLEEGSPANTALELDDASVELDSSLLSGESLDDSDFATPSLDELDTPLMLELDEDAGFDELAIANVSPESAVGFVEPPPALNLDDLELSSVPLDLPDAPISDGDESTSLISNTPTQGDTAQPEFGLESVPALTYDLSSTTTEPSSEPFTEPETTIPVPETVDAIVPLLEERLKVEYERRKVGEVVIRKQVETRMVQVPVRYEKLVIEQVGGEKPLAEVDLSQGALDAVGVSEVTGKPLVSGEFKSAKTASYVLDAIAKTLRHRCKNIRIEIELDDPRLQQAYQNWLNQCSQME